MGENVDDIVAAVAVIAGAVAAFDDDDHDESDEDELCIREPRRRIEPIFVDVDGFRRLEDKTFREHFRMNKIVFERLVLAVGNHLRRRNRFHRLRTPLDLTIMMSLWILATQDTFRSVAVKFSVSSRGTVHYHYIIFIEALREMAPMFIQWPNQFERDNISAHFERKYGYPGVVGCIDGTHIYISAPLVQAQSYINRFKKHSVLLQGVCDHRLLFRDIFVGQPGSVHDSRMFQRSPLSHSLLHNPEMLSPDEHIFGDGAYTLTDKVITPFRDNGNIRRRHRRHNYIHASARSAIERTFGLDKGLWRRQKLMMAFSLAYVIDTIVSSCVLHNFILLEGRPLVDEVHHEPLVAAVPAHPRMFVEGGDVPAVPEVDPALQPAKAAGRLKRDFISYLLYPHED